MCFVTMTAVLDAVAVAAGANGGYVAVFVAVPPVSVALFTPHQNWISSSSGSLVP